MAEGLEFAADEALEFSADYKAKLEAFKFNEVLEMIWEEIRALDRYLNEKEPWKIKDRTELTEALQKALDGLRQIGFELFSFLPETSGKIIDIFSKEKINALKKPLFPRIF